MVYQIRINTDNAAFQAEDNCELSRILHDLACSVVLNGTDRRTLRDRNGNTCGTAQLLEKV